MPSSSLDETVHTVCLDLHAQLPQNDRRGCTQKALIHLSLRLNEVRLRLLLRVQDSQLVRVLRAPTLSGSRAWIVRSRVVVRPRSERHTAVFFIASKSEWIHDQVICDVRHLRHLKTLLEIAGGIVVEGEMVTGSITFARERRVAMD